MTDSISHFGRKAQIESASRQAVAKGEPRIFSSVSQEAGRSAAPATDELRLSHVAQKAMQEPEFDRAKVDAIKTPIQQGQYPLDSRRIAENLKKKKKMIKG